jgi:hypothetical protein
MAAAAKGVCKLISAVWKISAGGQPEQSVAEMAVAWLSKWQHLHLGYQKIVAERARK